MKRSSILGWLIAFLLALTLFGPAVAQTAAQEDESIGAEATVTVEQPDSDELQTDLPPVEATTETPPTMETTSPPVEGIADPEATSPDRSEAPSEGDPSPAGEPVAVDEEASPPVETTDELPTTGGIGVYKYDDASQEAIAGAEFAIYASACPATGDPIAGPTFVGDGVGGDLGYVWFSDLPLDTPLCIVETTVPDGYTGGASVDMTLTQGMAFRNTWVGNTPEPGAVSVKKLDDFNAFVGGAGITLKKVDTFGLCTVAYRDEQFTESDPSSADFGTTFFADVPPGNYCAEETTTPEGYATADTAFFTVITGEHIVIEMVDVKLTQTRSIGVVKSDIRGYAVPGSGFTVFDETCTTPVTEEKFITRFSMSFEPLPYGTYCVKETTVPPGYDEPEPRIITVTETSYNTVGFVNTPREVGTIKVLKQDQDGLPVENAGFTIYQGSCNAEPAAAEQFTDANGVTIFTGLNPIKGYCVKETTVPDGYKKAKPDTQSVNFLYRDVALIDEVVWFINERIDGDVEPTLGAVTLLKYFCPVDVANDERVAVDIFYLILTQVKAASEPMPNGCYAGAADFEIVPFGTGDPIPVSTNDAGALVLDDLPVGEHLIREVAPNVSEDYPFEVLENGLTTIVFQNFDLPRTGTLEVTKYYCPVDALVTEIFVADPGEGPDLSGVTSDCWLGAADVTILPFNDPSADPIWLGTGGDGFASIDLPVTTAVSGPHLLVEDVSGKAALFEIAAGTVTSVTVVNVYDDEAEVTDLPVTGAGPVPGAGQPLLFIVGLLGLVAIVAAPKLRQTARTHR